MHPVSGSVRWGGYGFLEREATESWLAFGWQARILSRELHAAPRETVALDAVGLSEAGEGGGIQSRTGAIRMLQKEVTEFEDARDGT